jgi:hydroxymethylbilane synthase
LPQEATLATSSLRRAAQILHFRPDLKIMPMRGNVQTRLRKIEEGAATATILARAGLNRLKLFDVPAHDIAITDCLPAVAQGVIGIECRENDIATREMLTRINCATTMAAVLCERAFLRVLDGSCRTPIAGYAHIENNSLHFAGLIANPDGTNLRRVVITGEGYNAEALGTEAGKIIKKVSM